MESLKFLIILSLGLLSVLIFLVIRVCKCGIPGLLSKTVASLFFVLTAFSASFTSHHGLSAKSMVIIGLLCGLLGDIWLDLKVTYTNDIKSWLYSGFISFIAGHLFYLTAIMRISRMAPWIAVFALLSGVCLGRFTISLEKNMKLNYGSYKRISFIYASVLYSTFTSSLFACLYTGFQNTTLLFFLLGSLFFLVSDAILSTTYFGPKNREKPVWIIANHVTYYAAQYLIASSLFFL